MVRATVGRSSADKKRNLLNTTCEHPPIEKRYQFKNRKFNLIRLSHLYTPPLFSCIQKIISSSDLGRFYSR